MAVVWVRAAPPSGAPFKVMSYNILADAYCQPTSFPYLAKEHKRWNYRKKRIVQEITHYHADFVCLQVFRRSDFGVLPRVVAG